MMDCWSERERQGGGFEGTRRLSCVRPLFPSCFLLLPLSPLCVRACVCVLVLDVGPVNVFSLCISRACRTGRVAAAWVVFLCCVVLCGSLPPFYQREAKQPRAANPPTQNQTCPVVKFRNDLLDV